MPRLLLTFAALIAGILLGGGPAKAQIEGPWCAVYDIGPGSSAERCDFQTFEACRQEITGGNRGFCNNNSRWAGAVTGHAPARQTRKGRRN